jgi:HEAT repeat protein
MAKRSARQSFEEKLARLKELEDCPNPGDAVPEIRQALSSASSAVAARAARAAAKLELCDLTPELIAVFDRCLQYPVVADPGCRAKIAVIEALSALDYSEPEVFLRGIRHVQMEPSYGPPVDTADHLRAACAFGLYRLGYPELLYEMVSLLMDREPVARRAAIKVLTELGQESSALLLRSKILQGDKEPEILGDCFNGLMAIAPARSLEFVGRFLLAEDPAIAEEAALAIGNSRLRQAFMLLGDFRDRSVRPGFKRMLLLPLALTRCEEAFTLLLGVVQDEHPETAAAAVRALSIYSDNPERRERIQEAVWARNEPAVSAAYQKEIARK